MASKLPNVRARAHDEVRLRLRVDWRNSGFGVHNRTTVYPADSEGLHKLACYFMRPPVNLSSLRYHRDSQLFFYEPKAGQEVDDEALADPSSFWPACTSSTLCAAPVAGQG